MTRHLPRLAAALCAILVTLTSFQTIVVSMTKEQPSQVAVAGVKPEGTAR